jgi:hypothetical protein
MFEKKQLYSPVATATLIQKSNFETAFENGMTGNAQCALTIVPQQKLDVVMQDFIFDIPQ